MLFRSCSKRGLSERFDSTIGAGTVLMPFGGLRQRTPTLAMVNLIPSEKGDTNTCSVMAWDYDPYITSADPYKGAYLAVLGSVAKLIATTPFSKGYKPQFYFRTTDVTGEVELPADKEMVMPGDQVTFKVKLLAPIAMDKGQDFAIREGGRTVGAGVVTNIIK